LSAGFRGITALGCGGLLFGEMPVPSPVFSLIVVPLSVIGSFGTLIVQDLAKAVLRKTALPEHTWRVLFVTAILYLAGTGAMLLTDPPAAGRLRETLLSHDATFWAAHGWGAPVIYASGWHGNLIWIVLAVTVIGAGTAGTAGAFGLAWLVTLPKSVRATAYNGLTVAALQAALTLAVLAQFEPTLAPVRRVLLVASAVMNVGLSHEPLNITGIGLIALGICMIVAKLLPLVVIGFAVRHASYHQKEVP
jgi:hypothetical protein